MSRFKLESARVDLEPKNSRFATQVDVKVSDGVKVTHIRSCTFKTILSSAQGQA